MKMRFTLATRLTTSLLVTLLAVGCSGSVTGSFEDDAVAYPPGGSDPNNPGGGEEQPTQPGDTRPDDPACVGSPEAPTSGPCTVTGDCAPPEICVAGSCRAPLDPKNVCSLGEGKACEDPAMACEGTVCVPKPASCSANSDCPLGHQCSGGSCQPTADMTECPGAGTGPDLSGTWMVRSKLKLREALPGAVGDVLEIAATLDGIISGSIDLDLPSVVEFVAGAIVASVLDYYIPSWAQDFVASIGDMAAIFDNLSVESTMTLVSNCEGTYRGTVKWDNIIFRFNGREVKVRAGDLPGAGGRVEAGEFAAWYSCGKLYIDDHRVEDALSQMVPWMLETISKTTSGINQIEYAIAEFVDCSAIARTIAQEILYVCDYCPDVTNVAESACGTLMSNLGDIVLRAMADSSDLMSDVSLRGVIDASDGGTLRRGRWQGELSGEGFNGEFDATRSGTGRP
jgi:hypothetical protein